jgi:hypothetical protein
MIHEFELSEEDVFQFNVMVEAVTKIALVHSGLQPSLAIAALTAALASTHVLCKGLTPNDHEEFMQHLSKVISIAVIDTTNDYIRSMN